MEEARSMEERVALLEADVVKLRTGQQRLNDAFTSIGAKLDRNNELTETIAGIVSSFKGFARVVRWMGITLVFLGKYLVLPVVGVGVLIYAAFHHGHTPEFWGSLLKFFLGE